MKTFVQFALFAIKALILTCVFTQAKVPNFGIALLVGVAMTLAFEAVMIAGRAPFMSVATKLYKKHGRQGTEIAILLAIIPAVLALGLVVKLAAFFVPEYFPKVTGWFTAFATGGLMLFVSAALNAWCNLPFIVWDWTVLFKRPPEKAE